MRGLSGVGDYHLKPEFSRASIPSDELVLPKKLVAPSEIIEYLKQEQTGQTILAHPQSENSDETVDEEKNHTEHCEPDYLNTHTEVSNHTHQFPPSVTSQHSLARYVIDNN